MCVCVRMRSSMRDPKRKRERMRESSHSRYTMHVISSESESLSGRESKSSYSHRFSMLFVFLRQFSISFCCCFEIDMVDGPYLSIIIAQIKQNKTKNEPFEWMWFWNGNWKCTKKNSFHFILNSLEQKNRKRRAVSMLTKNRFYGRDLWYTSLFQSLPWFGSIWFDLIWFEFLAEEKEIETEQWRASTVGHSTGWSIYWIRSRLKQKLGHQNWCVDRFIDYNYDYFCVFVFFIQSKHFYYYFSSFLFIFINKMKKINKSFFSFFLSFWQDKRVSVMWTSRNSIIFWYSVLFVCVNIDQAHPWADDNQFFLFLAVYWFYWIKFYAH